MSAEAVKNQGEHTEFDPFFASLREANFVRDVFESDPRAFGSGVELTRTIFNIPVKEALLVFGGLQYSEVVAPIEQPLYVQEAFNVLRSTGLEFDSKDAATKWLALNKKLRNSKNYPVKEESELLGIIYGTSVESLIKPIELKAKAYSQLRSENERTESVWEQFEANLNEYYKALHKVVNSY